MKQKKIKKTDRTKNSKKIEITHEHLDKDFWEDEDNLLLFHAFLSESVDKDEYLLMKRQRTAVYVMMLDDFDLASAFGMYCCSGPSGYSLKSYYLMIQDFKSNESPDIVNETILELKRKKE